MQIRKREII